jgi:hypothetical protein
MHTGAVRRKVSSSPRIIQKNGRISKKWLTARPAEFNFVWEDTSVRTVKIPDWVLQECSQARGQVART